MYRKKRGATQRKEKRPSLHLGVVALLVTLDYGRQLYKYFILSCNSNVFVKSIYQVIRKVIRFYQRYKNKSKLNLDKYSIIKNVIIFIFKRKVIFSFHVVKKNLEFSSEKKNA